MSGAALWRSTIISPNGPHGRGSFPANAVKIRDLFKRAHDPNQFLFDDIPGTLDEDLSLANDQDLRRVVDNVHDGLKELVQAYPSMLYRLRDILLAELQVPEYFASITGGVAQPR